MNLSKERKAFDAWFSGCDMGPRRSEADWNYHAAWAGWQARAALTPPRHMVADSAGGAERLGEPFESILHDNLPSLYITDEPSTAPAQIASPASQWGDPRVQQVYEILCRDDAPPPGEHWEGFQARLIVDALYGASPAALTEAIAHAKDMVRGHYPNHREYIVAATLLAAQPPAAANQAGITEDVAADAARFRFLYDEMGELIWYPPGWNGNIKARFDLYWECEEKDLRKAIDEWRKRIAHTESQKE